MSLALSVGNQAYIFFCTVAGGMIMAFIYDLFRIKRKAIRTDGIIVYIEDFIFWILAALTMFTVVYFSNEGQLRGYLFLGTAIGVVLYVLLLSSLVITASMFIIRVLVKVFVVIFKVVTYPFRITFIVLKVPLSFIFKMTARFFRRSGRYTGSKLKMIKYSAIRFNKIRKKM